MSTKQNLEQFMSTRLGSTRKQVNIAVDCSRSMLSANHLERRGELLLMAGKRYGYPSKIRHSQLFLLGRSPRPLTINLGSKGLADLLAKDVQRRRQSIQPWVCYTTTFGARKQGMAAVGCPAAEDPQTQDAARLCTLLCFLKNDLSIN